MRWFKAISFSAISPGALYRSALYRSALSPSTLIMIVALWLATVGNLALWRTLVALPELAGIALPLAVAGTVVGLVLAYALLAALFAWRYTLKPFLILGLIVAAICSYFMLTYRVVIDRTMIVNALQTDTHETLELMNWRFAVLVLLLGALPSLWVWRVKVNYPPLNKALQKNIFLLLITALGVALSIWLSFQNLAVINRSHPQLRHTVTPFNALNGGIGALFGNSAKAKGPLLPIGTDVTQTPLAGKPPLLVLVVGETARADRFSLNGYTRPTNPLLPTDGVVSFTQAWSCGTNTAVSVPCMFSSLAKTEHENSKVRLENLLHVVARAGLGVTWIDNQAGCKGVCENLPTIDIDQTPKGKQCANGECRDTAMIGYLDGALQNMTPAQRSAGAVLVLHQMGSHGPAYYKRTDAAHKVFLPECETNALQQCDLSAVNNTYDNTIVATDAFLHQTIAWLKVQNDFASALVYVSDHGESLGENGLFLHGLPYSFAPDVQKHVPWISWFAPSFTQRLGVDAACLNKLRNTKISHDHYFHSVLGLLSLKTALYKTELDAYKTCYR